MKSIIILFAFSIFAFSCSDNKAAKLSTSESDTVKTAAKYLVGYEVKETFVFRVTKDTVQNVSDTSDGKITITQKMGTRKLYFIPAYDTVRTADGKPVLDSLGKAKFDIKFFPLDSKLVLLDYDKRF